MGQITSKPDVFRKQQHFKETCKKVEVLTSFEERIKWRYASPIWFFHALILILIREQGTNAWSIQLNHSRLLSRAFQVVDPSLSLLFRIACVSSHASLSLICLTFSTFWGPRFYCIFLLDECKEKGAPFLQHLVLILILYSYSKSYQISTYLLRHAQYIFVSQY